MRSKLELPHFEIFPEAVAQRVDDLIAESKDRTRKIGSQPLSHVCFESTVGELDRLAWEESRVMSRMHLLHNVSPVESIRKAAENAIVRFQAWSIERIYDRNVYNAVKAYADKNEKLDDEPGKLLRETLRDYHRLGLHLPEQTQEQLKALQKRLSEIETQFSSTINAHEDEIIADRADLAGLEPEFIDRLQKTPNGRYRISLQYPEYLPTMEFAKSEDLRKKLLIKKYNVAHEQNQTRLSEMIHLRKEIASLLGYPSWNHYVIEERMAKTPERVQTFIQDFEHRLRLKASAELNALTQLKAEETGRPQARIETWDYYYYASLYKKKHFEVDTRALKEFFPLDQVLTGFFQLIESLFDISFIEQPKGSFDAWHEDVRLIKVLSLDGSDLGAFYLDLFPRSGKYGHAAAFGISEGKLLSDGTYSRPVKAMVCNFSKEPPHLLSHSEVETLFHEFGHILHGILTWARFAKFSGTSVAWDFVEAPSQVLENWAWDYGILQMISKHIKDPQRKISKELVEQMDQAHKAAVGMFYLRQISFAKADLAIHGTEAVPDPIETINRVVSETFLPVPEGTSLGAGFGHLVGYASGYYGYAWADVMAADIFSLFKRNGLLNKELGLRLRKEIYETGSSRDETISLESFLQRPLSTDAFFEELGV